MTATKTLLAAVEALVRDALGDVLDVCERCDGDPAAAVEEHVAELRGARGTSVLVGYLSDDDVDEDEDTEALGAVLRATVIPIVRRGPRGTPDQAPSQARDTEALDDLYDAVVAALLDGRRALAPLFAGPIRLHRGQASIGGEDWFARVITVSFSRSLS